MSTGVTRGVKRTRNRQPTGGPYIRPNEHFRPDFNQKPFAFLHNLVNHPLFTLPRLLELAKATRRDRPGDLYYDAGPTFAPISDGTRWGRSPL